LILDKDNGSVKKVELAQSRDGPRYYTTAKKEVVVCLGSYGTPQLLLVSGIGGKEETKKAGSDQLVALDGVGKNLKDHLMAGPTYKTTPGTSGHYLLHPVKAVCPPPCTEIYVLTDF
jgi:choline dehydrogenase